jgi:hypothetical protein
VADTVGLPVGASFARIPGAGTEKSTPHFAPVYRSGLAVGPAADDIEISDIKSAANIKLRAATPT